MLLRCKSGAVAAVTVVAFAVSSVALVGTGAAGASRSVRGFDGTTITVAGLGIKAQLPRTEIGARARIKRFNDTNEIKGIKLKFAELADDNQDPATALSEARRLVTEVGVFALVGDISPVNPGNFFAQQHVPYFGGGFDQTYCSDKPSTSLWGFSDAGCIVPKSPSFIADLFHAMYIYTTKKTGKKHPTFIVIGPDNTSGKNGARIFAIAGQGTGFKVVGTQTKLPEPTPPADYSPFVNDAMTADHGKAPDSLFCEASAVECLQMYQLMKARGYTGVFEHGIWTNALVKPFAGSVINNPTVNPIESNPGMDKMKADLEAYQAGSTSDIDYGILEGYLSTDMFIQALKTVAKQGKSNITPENIQKVASKITWGIKGIRGPIQYPKSTVMGEPACFSNYYSDGTKWTTAVPFTCSTKTFSPKLKIG